MSFFYFHHWQTFLSMGGYARFVWPSYAIFFAVIVGNIQFTRVVARRTMTQLRSKILREDNESRA